VKAEIVGENAENISYIEEALDIYVVFNDLPNIISVSCYNLLNQHIAAKAIEKLTNAKGHVKIGDVGEVIKVAKKEVENELEKIGKDIADKLGLKNRSKRLYELIGRLKYRTSYGQNILKHSLEVAYVSMMLGGELGLNVEVCKVGGFLHDLGKAIDQDPNVQEGHDFLTKKLMEELGFSPEEVHAAWTHHEAEAPQTPEAKVVMAADAVSAGRPGARQETLDKYLERLRALEEIANSFAGVKKSFAISAGREIRVIVDPQEVDDAGVQKTATGLAKQIEENLQYPGKIKINVIRRVKALDTAK
ncbi:HD domain-containing protein, partial [Patescibacteria group bacterium]|nr:HD domain-containing protein [Patescibacteria group bacterium]